MQTRVKVILSQAEYAALEKIASSELRSPPDQLRQILRKELAERGLLPVSVTPAERDANSAQETISNATAR